MQANVVPEIIPPIRYVPPDITTRSSLKSIPLAEPLQSSVILLCIKILIGLDDFYEIAGTDRLSFHDSFQLLQSSVGLTSTGNVYMASTHLDREGYCLFIESISIPDSEFELERFWVSEHVGLSYSSGDDDSIAVDVIKKSIKIDQGLQTAHPLPTFVRNRVKVIQAVTDVKKLIHIDDVKPS